WIAQSKIAQGDLISVSAVTVLCAVAAFGLSLRPQEPVDNGVALLVSGFIIAGVAFLAPSASIAQLALAITAATGGFLVWTWPKIRLGFAQVAIVAMALPMIWLAAQASHFSRADDYALIVVTAIAFAPTIRAAVIRSDALSTDTLRPIATGVTAVVIGAVALAIAYFSSSGQTYLG
ncbi:MAG: hypothetical protein AAF724_03970, partial [Pseudomonadota bacterium]